MCFFFSRKTIIYKLVKDLSSLAISFNFSIYCANLILLSLETKFFHIVTPDSCQLYTPPLPVHIPYATNRPTEFSRVFALTISFALEMPPSGSPLSVRVNPEFSPCQLLFHAVSHSRVFHMPDPVCSESLHSAFLVCLLFSHSSRLPSGFTLARKPFPPASSPGWGRPSCQRPLHIFLCDPAVALDCAGLLS